MRAWHGSPLAARSLVAAYGGLPRGAIELACHAAVPVALDTGLLHLLRVNFLLDPPAMVPYEAEAALLLSPLARPIGDGLFEIDPLLRPLRLTGLTARFGGARGRRVAALLEQYSLLAPAWRDRPELVHAQRLSALALVDPPLATAWLARAEPSIADGSALLNKEWLVAVRRSIDDHGPPGRVLDVDVFEAFQALLSGTAPDRTAAVHRLGELALVPGADVEAIARMLAAHAGEESRTGRTAREVLDTINGLGPAIREDDSPVRAAPSAREDLLDMWRTLVAASYPDGAWIWGGQVSRNATSDAQQLLCLLGPATQVPGFALDRPDDTDADVLDALHSLGDGVTVPQLLIRICADYLQTYQSPDGSPAFTGAVTALDPDEAPTAQQQALDMTESFAVSVRLTLATLGFVRTYRQAVTRPDLLAECDALEQLAHERLTAALVGVMRSFTVNTFTVDSEPGQRMLSAPQRRSAAHIRESLRQVIAEMQDVTVGIGSDATELVDRDDLLFECGWSWGIVAGAPRVEWDDGDGQRQGYASPQPDPRPTRLALEAADALHSQRTLLLGLLLDNQQRLASALSRRAELTTAYWKTMAANRPDLIELSPHAAEPDTATYDGVDIVAILLRDRVAADAMDRYADALQELASRSGVIATPSARDAVLLDRGTRHLLRSAERLGPALANYATDFVPQLLLQITRLTAMLRGGGQIVRAGALRDMVLAHVLGRRDTAADAPAEPVATLGWRDGPDWSYALAVIDALSSRL